jgi:hypothetical protein
VPSSQRAVAAAVLVIVGIVAARAVLAAGVQPVFSVSDFQASADGGGAPGARNNPPELRELPIAGKKLSVLYWKNIAGGADGTVSAEVPITGVLAYRMRLAYSCGSRDCAGATLKIEYLDFDGSVLDDAAGVIAQPLAQDRIDNDLFWDQLDRRLEAPRSARAARVQFSVTGGGGSLVVPYLTLESDPSLLQPWRMDFREAAAIAILCAGMAGGVWMFLSKSRAATNPRKKPRI